MGSGNHAKSYLHRTARGALIELPLARSAILAGIKTSAVNAAVARMREVTKDHMSKLMGGMNIPGMPPGMF